MSDNGRNHLKHEFLVGGISNTFFNGLIAWLLLRSGPSLGWSGAGNFVGDIFATSLLLPFIVAIIVIPLQRKKLGGGKLQPINLGSDSLVQSVADRFPATTFKAALLFGMVGICIIAPFTLLGFYLAGVDALAPLHYAIFKGVWERERTTPNRCTIGPTRPGA